MVNFNVTAEIFDIKKDNPKPEDSFLVDTNVLLWLTYPRLISDSHDNSKKRIDTYISYFSKALKKNCGLFYAPFSVAELIHLVEKTEMGIYIDAHSGNEQKYLRHCIDEYYDEYLKQLNVVWEQLPSLCCSLNVTTNKSMIDSAYNRLQTQKVDGYDLFILEAMKQNGITRIITDDGDFSTIPGIHVHTVNPDVLRSSHRFCKYFYR